MSLIKVSGSSQMRQKGSGQNSRAIENRGQKIVILLMKKNINWFGSPIPRPAHFAETHLQQHVELDESPTPRQPHSPHPPIYHSLPQQSSLHVETHLSSIQALQLRQGKAERNQIDGILVYSEEQEDAGLLTPLPGEDKKQRVCTTSRKNQDQAESVEKRTRPKDKGLKGVSARAYELVKISKETSYKEMANVLLKQFNPFGTVQSRTEEINIRRRVYDALNVFLALDILHKDGRRLVNNNPQKRNLSQPQKQYDTLYQKITQKQEIVKQKRSKLAQVQAKLKNARELLKRNIHNKSKGNACHIAFPFIGIVGFAECRMEEFNETSVALRLDTMVFPFGDMDSLNYL